MSKQTITEEKLKEIRFNVTLDHVNLTSLIKRLYCYYEDEIPGFLEDLYYYSDEDLPETELELDGFDNPKLVKKLFNTVAKSLGKKETIIYMKDYFMVYKDFFDDVDEIIFEMLDEEY